MNVRYRSSSVSRVGKDSLTSIIHLWSSTSCSILRPARTRFVDVLLDESQGEMSGHGKSGVFHSAEWHDGDWSGEDGVREAWLWFFICESFLSFWLG
ncbi:hypothetical protein TNCV_3494711 [Trichonephila clavipes]|nr:hypothetical protein TNCV_3494711 [Trichonephila clavipes]